MERAVSSSSSADAITPSGSFDFDAWASLAQQDPSAFERQRRITIDLLIERMGGGNDERVEQLRQRIDLKRARRGSLEGLLWMMQELNAAFTQLNAEVASQLPGVLPPK